ncbi:MAG TPA: hydroxysqualene dehydroxylase HpnE [Terriglobia bacterium]|nr:hydroxysqualene dehydroxylase HpnE [Terriglobia bacterium]
MPDEILIIGGGFAGLTAGVALAQAGRRVRLLEQKPHLGGRASSFLDPATGSVVDNGQHLFMGCYHQTIEFLKTIGTLDRVRFQSGLSVKFLDSGGSLSALVCPRLPAPWHLLVGVLRSGSFKWSEKLEVLRIRAALSRRGDSNDGNRNLTVDQWLKGLGQSENLRQYFWNLICIAAMNEDPRIASAALFERVLKLALFSSANDSRLGIARVGLSDCYTTAAAEFISAHGGRVELGQNVTGLLVSDGGCQGVTLAGGERVQAQTVLSAAPWNKFTSLLPGDLLRNEPFFTKILSLRPAPIISINLWFDRPVTNLEFVGLRGTTIQWLFNKSRILDERGRESAASALRTSAPHRSYISLVLSGAHEHIGRSKEDLLAMAMGELQGLMPEAKQAKLVHSLIVKERFATFSPCVGVEDLRPTAATPVRGLYLAGDWTATGLPATIEGAVKSGYTAAGEILQTT